MSDPPSSDLASSSNPGVQEPAQPLPLPPEPASQSCKPQAQPGNVQQLTSVDHEGDPPPDIAPPPSPGRNYSPYYLKMRERMIALRVRPSHPPGAFCLFSEERRSELRNLKSKLCQREQFAMVKREWKSHKDQRPYKDRASQMYREYKELTAEWEASLVELEEGQESGVVTRGRPQKNIIIQERKSPEVPSTPISHLHMEPVQEVEPAQTGLQMHNNGGHHCHPGQQTIFTSTWDAKDGLRSKIAPGKKQIEITNNRQLGQRTSFRHFKIDNQAQLLPNGALQAQKLAGAKLPYCLEDKMRILNLLEGADEGPSYYGPPPEDFLQYKKIKSELPPRASNHAGAPVKFLIEATGSTRQELGKKSIYQVGEAQAASDVWPNLRLTACSKEEPPTRPESKLTPQDTDFWMQRLAAQFASAE